MGWEREKDGMSANEKCATYLKSKDLMPLMEQVRKKWESYGKFTGMVSLKNPSISLREDLEKILGKHLNEPVIKVTIKEFVSALENSSFSGIDFKVVMDCYFSETVLTTKEKKQIKEEQQNTFYEMLYQIGEKSGCEEIHQWIVSMIEHKDSGYRILLRKENMEQVFTNVVEGISLLLKTDHFSMPLSVFASLISGNPHFLDRGSDGANLLMAFLSYYYHIDMPSDSQAWYFALECAGLMKDAIAGSVALYNVHLIRHDGAHKGAECSYQYKEPFMLTSATLSGVRYIECEKHIAYVVENEMVFTYLQNKIQDTSIALICTSGQLSTTAQILLQKMVESKVYIYYSGDLDPEGINICERLYEKYPEYLKPWRMDESVYLNAMSHEEIQENRLALLENLQNPVLKETGEKIKKVRKSGYQENVLNLYIQDLLK